MVHFSELRVDQEYFCQQGLSLYKTPSCESLVTQAAVGRHLHFLAVPAAIPKALHVCLCEDDYPGWLAAAAIQHLTPAAQEYAPQSPTTADIQTLIPAIIGFAREAMAVPNTYLWGGTLGPHYDCSGLMQAAFASVGVMLPRDSYQQEAFTEPVAIAERQPGDLLFFGTRDRTTHVALYLGAGNYIHSSGKDQGRNGIGIDSITDRTDPVSRTYYEQLRGAGRVTRSYQPQKRPMPCR
ncbi:MAG: C40 family peptidase [Cyanobacteria bacterium J06639_14]